MTTNDAKYPNKADFEPNVDEKLKEAAHAGELPLSDPAESNATEVFRGNEAETEGEHKQSAFGENKDAKKEKGMNKNSPLIDEKTVDRSYNKPKSGEQHPFSKDR